MPVPNDGLDYDELVLAKAEIKRLQEGYAELLDVRQQLLDEVARLKTQIKRLEALNERLKLALERLL